MKPLGPVLLGLCALFVAFLSAAVHSLLLALGYSPPEPPAFLALLFLLLASCLLWLGVHVRRLRAHEETWMRPMVAARVAAFARASAFVSTLMCGTYAGLTAVCLLRAEADLLKSVALWAGATALAAFLWWVCALLVERWCIVDGSDGDSTETPGAQDPSASAA